ncbi:GNAT family N-acetyltransferase [Paenibacillus radicibacter]|uniref:GNAT family N-acetyltransferase n=1 Tax=Paenibacillus radicibacter TaxID=2972488 RepID=UPI0021594677|nr:GNAT family N-acetyltransferase [Paenibacillus radicibacter]
MRIEDYDSISKLWGKLTEVNISLEFDNRNRMNSYLTRNPGLSSVAIIKEEVVGTALCGHDGRRGSLFHVVLDENIRGNGISKQMIERSINCLKEIGIDNGFLFVSNTNESAQSYWKYNGWKPLPEVTYFYKTFE